MLTPVASFPNVVYNIPTGPYSLTQPEVKFLAYAKPLIDERISGGATEVFISHAQKMKDCFEAWSSKNFVQVPQSELASLIESIWSKTKVCVEEQIASSHNTEYINDERQCQAKADEITKAIIRDGLEGKTFTLRQAQWLSHVTTPMLTALK